MYFYLGWWGKDFPYSEPLWKRGVGVGYDLVFLALFKKTSGIDT
jgi:hypothetical protein